MIEHPIVKRPAVARTGSRVPALLGGATAVALGLGVFFGLDARRAAHAEGTLPPQDQIMIAPPQPLPVMPAPPVVPAPQFTVNNNTPAPPPPPQVVPVNTSAEDAALRQRLAAPALIVDITDARAASAGAAVPVQYAMQSAVPTNPALAGAAAGAAIGTAAAGAQGTTSPSSANAGVEQDAFSRRIGDGAERVRATQIGDLDMLVPQGATIEGVLETALDSDLPGYARALISRDVLSFDGANVLIPRGSRVIGQYKAATALGASRIFVIWSRIIRPDGVSIQIGSPGTDELGRAGVGGKVDRHFLQRFGGSILLTVLNGGLAAGTAALTSGNGVFIGTASQATGLASSALTGTDIPPTIRTPQGAAVRIFVARDLDFSTVGPAR